jgi:NAD(P)-dependent dehydrogenase (short-subunit alcohol dehydrogenase family)
MGNNKMAAEKMLEGKVAIITGAGRGLGREEALLMAQNGCNLVINDLGGAFDGSGSETKVADQVAEECKKLGVKAVGNYDSVSDFNKAKALVDQAVSEFGKLDIVVNNAGILRDRMVYNMSEAEFDSVIGVHLKGTFNMIRHASAYFREQYKVNPKLKNFARFINTASDAGLLGNQGQVNYGAAKAGIAAMTIIAALELKDFATVNCIVPMARTRLTTDATPKFADVMEKKDEKGFDVFNPVNVPPLIVYLASDEAKRVNGEIFRIVGDKVWLMRGWHSVAKIENGGQPFTPEILVERMKNDLLKGAPKKETIMEITGQLIKM